MTLSELIEHLKKQPGEKMIALGFRSPHSYRGYYDQLAFEPTPGARVTDMLKCANESLGKEFEGYKGGVFRMGPYTDVNLAHYGHCGVELTEELLYVLLATHAEGVPNAD